MSNSLPYLCIIILTLLCWVTWNYSFFKINESRVRRIWMGFSHSVVLAWVDGRGGMQFYKQVTFLGSATGHLPQFRGSYFVSWSPNYSHFVPDSLFFGSFLALQKPPLIILHCTDYWSFFEVTNDDLDEATETLAMPGRGYGVACGQVSP
jgi:hypothetical protein